MEKKFTPGEWTVTQEGINKFITCNGVDITEVYELANPDTAHYNARLLSAAPDLVVALQDMLYWFGTYPEFVPNPDTIESYKQTISQARKALAKALGSTPNDE